MDGTQESTQMGFRGMEAGHESRFNVHNAVAKEMVETMGQDVHYCADYCVARRVEDRH